MSCGKWRGLAFPTRWRGPDEKKGGRLRNILIRGPLVPEVEINKIEVARRSTGRRINAIYT